MSQHYGYLVPRTLIGRQGHLLHFNLGLCCLILLINHLEVLSIVKKVVLLHLVVGAYNQLLVHYQLIHFETKGTFYILI